MEEVKTWRKLGGVATPGGEPCFVCPVCGKGKHLYGVEFPESYDRCPDCGTKLVYPAEY